jgi:cytidine deaminase
MEKETLLAQAKEAALRAYAPYSSFRVGAAVLCSEGHIATGANIENASYGLCLCAERAALSNAYAQGHTNIKALALACIDADTKAHEHELMPCGSCRQWIKELAPDATIYIEGLARDFAIEDLLPMGFSLDSHKENDS